MSMATLGRLEPVDLRSVWANEAAGFTPWLAQESNLAALSDTLSISLQLEAQEKYVGAFKADLLCKNTLDDSWVLIENQLERTDHGHLGQLLTYAAGLEAVSIVWIARRFAEEHRAALDWLNRITAERIQFFGVELELWRIGGSVPAPRFHVVAKPNDWSKLLREAVRHVSGESSELDDLYLEYWTAFSLEMERNGVKHLIIGPRPKYSINLQIGRSGFRLGAFASQHDKVLGAELQINIRSSSKNFYRQLVADREEVSRHFDETLDWQELPDQTRSRITCRKRDVEVAHPDSWGTQHRWLADQLVRLDRVFREHVRTLSIAEELTDASDMAGDHP